MTLRTLNYGNYGIFLIMGHAGFCPSTGSSSIWARVRANQCRGLNNQNSFFGAHYTIDYDKEPPKPYSNY